MAVDERTRHELHQRLDEALGVDAAATLMTHLPPSGWGDIVTRECLDVAFRAQDGRFDRLEERIEVSEHRVLAAVRREIIAALAQQTRTTIFALIASIASVSALAFTLAQLG